MGNFETIQPSPLLMPYVKLYWFLGSDAAELEDVPVQRVVPTGHVTMVFHRGHSLVSAGEIQPRAFLSGQSTGFSDLFQTGNLDMMVVVFHPQGARAFFKTPLSEVCGINVSPFDLGDDELAELEKQVTDSHNNQTCVDLIENFLLRRLRYGTEYNQQRVAAVIDVLNKGEISVKQLATVSCLSEKQFRRVFSEYIGVNPKDFIRVVRFQRALFILQNTPNILLTQLAFDCGYYDQPHLIREFKEFSGYTPSEYRAACGFVFSDYFSQ